MNLTNFLEQTNAIAAQYSSMQLIAFIHDIGRVLPEDKREDFLKRLKAAGKEIEGHLKKKIQRMLHLRSYTGVSKVI